MILRSELGSALLGCLKEVYSLLERAYNIAQDEQDALVKSDAERITLSYKAQGEVLRRITEADQRAAAIATQLAEAAGFGDDSNDMDAIVEAAGYPYSQLIRDQIALVTKHAKKVQQANEVNAHLLQNGIEIITSCLRTLVSEPQPAAYSRDASLSQSEICVLSVDRRV